jgi:hypothetical protein
MIVTPLVPQIQAAIASHPNVSVVLAGIFGIVAHFMTSPLDAKS